MDIAMLENELLELQTKCYNCYCYINGTSCRKTCKYYQRIDEIETILEEQGEL